MPDIKENTRPIGVFDSGVGGLSVLIELRRLLPNENFVFLADQSARRDLMNPVCALAKFAKPVTI